jgi:lipopolysaccharide export LptBFGC system permease protein LptF
MALLIRPAIPAWRLLNIVSLGEGEKKTSSWWYFYLYFYRDIFFPFAVTFSSRKSFPFTVTFSSRKSTGKSD